MNRKSTLIITTSLMFISSLIIVGSGFALWEFNEGDLSSNELEVSINVENYLEFGEINITKCPNYFYIESNNDQYSNYGGLVFYTKNQEGIDSLSSEFSFTITPKDGYIGESYSVDDFKASLSFKINDPLNKYFEIDKESKNLNNGTYDSFIDDKYIFKMEEVLNETNSFKVSSEGYLSLNGCFKYKKEVDGQSFNPLNEIDFKKMVDELGSYVLKEDQPLISLTLTIEPTDNLEI